MVTHLTSRRRRRPACGTGRRTGRGLAAAGLAATALLGACAPADPEPHGGFVAGGVRVTARLRDAAGPAATVLVTLAPDAGFHVYSVDLPAGGVDGVGRPSRVTVVSGLSAAGPVTADRPVQRLRPAGLDTVLDVYPQGPVTISLPVGRQASPVAGSDGGRDPVIEVSYAACSDAVCRPPVDGHRLTLTRR